MNATMASTFAKRACAQMGTLTENQQLQIKLVSELLQYPDEEFMKRLPDFEAVVSEMPDEESRKRFDQFIVGLKSRTRIQLLETYTTVFDMNPSTTLNVTYHLWGDGEKRADVLVRLQQLYLAAGYERVTGELPDYLPLMLEFLAFCPDARGIDVLWQCLGGLRQLIDYLRETAPNYAALLEVLAGIVSNPIGEAVSGPGADRVDREAEVE
jgi:nitrate reductase molybdenum cofactor assembly chaperone NarJ/NarW